MSLTQTRHLFGGISETGIDHFLARFFTSRPHLLAYAFGVPFADPMKVTLINTSSLPSFLSGLQGVILFAVPTVDITPADSATEPLPPGANQFTISTEVEIILFCGEDRNRDDFGFTRNAHQIVAKLGLAALCEPNVVDSSPGTGSVGIRLLAVKIGGITPDAIEQMLECILAAVLRFALAQVRIPFQVFTVGGVSLTLQEGPVAEEDQIEVRGDIT